MRESERNIYFVSHPNLFPSLEEFMSVKGNKETEYEFRKGLFVEYVKSGDELSIAQARTVMMDPVWHSYPPFMFESDIMDMSRRDDMLPNSRFLRIRKRRQDSGLYPDIWTELSSPWADSVKATVNILRYLLDYNIALLEKPYFPNSEERDTYRKNVSNYLRMLTYYGDAGREPTARMLLSGSYSDLRFWAAHYLLWIDPQRSDSMELVGCMRSAYKIMGARQAHGTYTLLYDTAVFNPNRLSVFEDVADDGGCDDWFRVIDFMLDSKLSYGSVILRKASVAERQFIVKQVAILLEKEPGCVPSLQHYHNIVRAMDRRVPHPRLVAM